MKTKLMPDTTTLAIPHYLGHWLDARMPIQKYYHAKSDN
jgi:hypothetical protein